MKRPAPTRTTADDNPAELFDRYWNGHVAVASPMCHATRGESCKGLNDGIFHHGRVNLSNGRSPWPRATSPLGYDTTVAHGRRIPPPGSGLLAVAKWSVVVFGAVMAVVGVVLACHKVMEAFEPFGVKYETHPYVGLGLLLTAASIVGTLAVFALLSHVEEQDGRIASE